MWAKQVRWKCIKPFLGEALSTIDIENDLEPKGTEESKMVFHFFYVDADAAYMAKSREKCKIDVPKPKGYS